MPGGLRVQQNLCALEASRCQYKRAAAKTLALLLLAIPVGEALDPIFRVHFDSQSQGAGPERKAGILEQYPMGEAEGIEKVCLVLVLELANNGALSL